MEAPEKFLCILILEQMVIDKNFTVFVVLLLGNSEPPLKKQMERWDSG